MTKTKKLVRNCLALAVCAALAVMAAGCGSSSDAATKTKKTYPAIGKKSSAKYVYQINTTNKTDKKITGFAIKDSSTNKYSDNMLTAKKPFKVNQKRTLYYDAKKAIQAAAKQSKDGKELNPEYTIQLTFEDKSTAELHSVPLDGIKTMQIKYDKDKSVAYLSYKAKGNKETVSTQSDEAKIKADADAKAAAAKKAAQEKAAQQQAAAAAAARQQQAASNTTRRSATSNYRRSTTTTPSRSTRSSSRSSSSSSSGSSRSAASATSGAGCVGNGAMY